MRQGHVKSAVARKRLERRPVRARMVRVWVQVPVRRQVPAPGSLGLLQSSTATRTGWDSASVQVHEMEKGRALGRARQFGPAVERLEQL